jgi:hypothetical protein
MTTNNDTWKGSDKRDITTYKINDENLHIEKDITNKNVIVIYSLGID